MTSNLICPNCNQADSVRKVSAIYSEGMATSSVLVRHSEGGHSYGSGKAQTSLSKKLSPPELPEELSGFGKIIAWVFFLAPFGVALLLAQTYFQRLSIGNNDSLMLISIIICVGFGIFLIAMYSKDTKRKNEMRERWERVKPKWDKLYYCGRCDGVFTLESRKFIAVNQIDEYLK